MIAKIRSKPIRCSIAFTLAIFVCWAVFTMLIQVTFAQAQILAMLTAVVTIVFSIVALVLFGMIHQINGFKYVLSVAGFAKGLLALLPVIAFFVFNVAISAIRMEAFRFENGFALIALSQAVSAFMANVLFRGLLVTALLIRFSNTKSERIKSVFNASALYLVVYIPLSVLNTGEIALTQLVNTFIINAGFCAAYLYAKNLLSLMVAQGVWQVLGAGIAFFGIEGDFQYPPWVYITLILLLPLIVAFAVIISRRSAPFSIDFPPHAPPIEKVQNPAVNR